MSSCEDDAWSVTDDAVKKYEQHSHDGLPMYEYTDVTESDNFGFSILGAKKLAKFTNGHIKENKSVHVPPDYHSRLY